MHAVFIEVDNDGSSNNDEVRTALEQGAVPRMRAVGARGAFWLAPAGGRGVSVVVFDSEAEATTAAADLHVGERPAGAPEGITFRTVEVREVLASL